MVEDGSAVEIARARQFSCLYDVFTINAEEKRQSRPSNVIVKENVIRINEPDEKKLQTIVFCIRQHQRKE